MSGALFDPARTKRGRDGCRWHPDLDQFMRGPDGGAPRQDEGGWLDKDAITAAGFEFRDAFTEDEPEYFTPNDERPKGAGWQLVAAQPNEDGGTDMLWVRAAGATGGEA